MIVQLNLRADILKSQHKQVILWVDITIKNHFFWIPGSKLKGRRGSGKTEGTVYGVCLLRVDVGFGEVELREREKLKPWVS